MARRKQRRKRTSRIGVLSISFVVLCLFAAITYKGQQLHAKNQEYSIREESLKQKLEDEERRTAELEEYSKYVQTKKYIEEVAREKLGLIYKDEIIFKAK